MKKFIFIVLIIVFISFNANAADKLHIVQPGDTLWSLSKKHYKDPYLWGKIWMDNTYLNDPNLIFPGEIIEYTKYGIVIYKSARKREVSRKENQKSKYDSFVFFDGYKYYSDCGGGFCVWRKKDFSIGKIRYDRYKNVEVKQGNTIFVYTNHNINVGKFYIYREVKDYFNMSICPGKSISVFVPVGEVKVMKKLKPDVYEGVIDKSYASINSNDIVSCVYPYKLISKNPKSIKLGNIPVKLIGIRTMGLTTHIGYYMFFKVKKGFWKFLKRRSGSGYHIVKEQRNIGKNIVGRIIYLDRVNVNIPVNTTIGRGVVVSQYRNYISVFFKSYGNGLKEIPDITQNYVLR